MPATSIRMQASYDLLRAARAALDMSTDELCAKAGISKRSLVRIEACEPVGLEVSMRVQKALEEDRRRVPPTRPKPTALASGVRKGLVREDRVSDRRVAPDTRREA